MANIRISDLTDLTNPTGSSVFPISHQGATRKLSVDNLVNYINITSTGLNPIYSTISRLNSSGINLTNTINSLSGSLNLSGTSLTNNITSLRDSLNLSGTSLTNTINSLSGSLNSSGTSLTNTINSLSGSLNSSGTSLTNNITSLSGLFTGYTGSLDAGFASDLQLSNTGSSLLTTVNSLSGSLNSSGIALINNINSLSGLFTGYTGSLDNTFATDSQLNTTGSQLNNHIRSLSGFLNSSAVFITGNQNISGAKTFFDSGIFSLSGASTIPLPNNPLSIVGSGNTYVQLNIQNRGTGAYASADLVITANNGTDNSNYLDLGINNSGYNDPTFSNGSGYDGYLYINGGSLDIGTQTTGTTIEFHIGGTTASRSIARITESGFNLVSGIFTTLNRPFVNGTGVLLSGEAGQISSVIVQTTGTQNIGGLKTFTDTGAFNNIQINNKVFTSYNYITGGIFYFDNSSFSVVNSSLSTTGVLPSGVTSGINYYVKNLNTGILTITGSGQRIIDGFLNVNLYQNDSVNLLGINNIGYTGWISTIANGGVS